MAYVECSIQLDNAERCASYPVWLPGASFQYFKETTAMLDTARHLDHYALHASDGFIGHIRGVYFDDQSWVVRYFVGDIGGWLPGRKVLISPMSVTAVNAADRVLTLALTKD